MECYVINNLGNGIVLLENFFTEKEYEMMWNELEFLCEDDMLIDSKNVGGAVDPKTGQPLRVNRGVAIESVMDANNSDIVRLTRLIFEKQVIENLCNIDEMYHYLSYPTKEFNLVNHYMGGHKYDYHRDSCVITAITLFWKDPKLFTGGELSFKSVTPKMKPRDMLLFPSYLLHAVSNVQLNEGVKPENMNGRISVSKFIKVA